MRNIREKNYRMGQSPIVERREWRELE